MASKVIIMSDVHLCQGDWHGMPSPDRMNKMVADLNAAYEREPYDAIFFLGDYSLDFWKYEKSGSYLYQGVSNTQNLVSDYLPRLLCPNRYLIPGNHEQYGHEKWQQITGMPRQFSVLQDGYLFLMLDTFGGDLDPDFDSDGAYTPADVDFIRTEMAGYPDAPVILCAHFFALQRETGAFKELVKNEKRIACLFCGHDHLNRIEAAPELGGKLIIHDGHFSYSGFHDASRCPWGWTEVRLLEEGLICTYVHPESEMDGLHIYPGDGPMIQLQLDADRPFPRRK